MRAEICLLTELPAAHGLSPSFLNRDLGSASQYSQQRVMAKFKKKFRQSQRIFTIYRPSLQEIQSVLWEEKNVIQKERDAKSESM